MKIFKLKTSATQTPPEFDFKEFAEELAELSERYGIKLVSLGAVNGLSTESGGMNYLAIWSSDVDAE